MKKIIFSFVLFIGTIFSANIYVENISVSSDTKEILVPVKISSNEKFSGFQFNLFYNKEILDFEGFSNGDIVSDFNILVNEIRKSFVRIAGFSPSLEEVSGEGVLVYIKFSVKKAGRSFISVTGIKLSDKSGKKINCSGRAGSVNIEGEADEENKETEKNTDSPSQSSPSSTLEYSSTFSPADKNPQIKASQFFPRQPRASSSSLSLKDSGIHKEKTHKITEGNFNISSDNCVLLVSSKYGNPSPPAGFTTFNRGENIVCKVEKEIPVSEMEKVVCTGYEGTGSAGNGNSNMASFVINEDSKIVWKWIKKPMEPEFKLQYPEKTAFPYGKNKIEIPVFCKYYGGLKSNIVLKKEKMPDGFEIKFPEINYKNKKGFITISIKKDVKAGNYKLSFISFPENKKEMKKTYSIGISVEGLLKITRKKEGKNTLAYFQTDKIGDFKKFFIEVEFKGNVSIKKIIPEKTLFILRKNSVVLSGDKKSFDKLMVILSGEVENVKLDMVRFFDKNNHIIKVKTEI